MLTNQFITEIKNSRHILLAGAGGGHDIYSCIPLFYMLRNLGKQLSIASYSFTKLHLLDLQQVCPYCSYVDHQTKLPDPSFYFPEKWLTDWFHNHNVDISIYISKNRSC